MDSSPSFDLSGLKAFMDKPIFTKLYRPVGYLGLVSIFGSELYGFRYDSSASPWNYLWNLLLYGVFIVPHLVMTGGWFKEKYWGNPAGTQHERQVYILVSVATWWAVWFLQWPLPGGHVGWLMNDFVQYVGILVFLLCFVMFFQGVTFEMMNGLLGVPGSQGGYTHGAETPLFSEGPYAEVRHPMYRRALLAGLSTLLIHPHAPQLFWAVLISGTFVAYIPIEEAQLLTARGEEYRSYKQRTPYRLFRGVW